METTKVFASGATCVNDEAAPAGPITAIGRIWVFLGAVGVAVAFLRRVPWALPAMTGLNYLALGGLVAFGLGSNALWSEAVRAAGAPAAAAMLGPMALFVALAVSALPLILMLRSLHGSRVRASFEAAPRS